MVIRQGKYVFCIQIITNKCKNSQAEPTSIALSRNATPNRRKKYEASSRMDAVQPNEIVERKYQRMNIAVPRLELVLEQALGEEGTARLCSLLQATGAIIAGGSVLQAFQDATVGDAVIKSQDIDIYVPVQTAPAFFDVFVRDEVDAILKKTSTSEIQERSYKSAMYCKSFLHKNGIKKVYNFIKIEYTEQIGRRGRRIESHRIEFDVMIVRNRRTPLQVVNNFDLTFCQIWFDGSDIYASHPEDIKRKKGTLQGEYVDLFLKGNTFLHKRIKKYGDRGYKIALDRQSADKDITQNVRVQAPLCKRRDDSNLMKHWSSRVLLYWFLNIRDNIRAHHVNMPPNIKHNNILIVPLVNASASHRQTTTRMDLFGGLGWSNNTIPTKEDGYDSEDYTENSSFQELIYKRFLEERTPTDLVKIPTKPTKPTKELHQLLFHRGANKLLEIAMWPNIYNYRSETLGNLLEQRLQYINRGGQPENSNNNLERAALYYNELKSRCIRKGISFITQEEDVEVYDLHEHPMEAGISAEDLEGYLQHHITDIDKSEVPCYYKPNPANHADPVNCKRTISLSEVKYITSKEFYEKYSAPAPEKLGLDQFMSHYNQTLQNSPSEDPTYGLEYHHSVCPFCLQFESRDSGCSYMVHENRKHKPSTHAPFCDERIQIKDLIDRYKAVSEEESEVTHLEFCAECGRPCVNHAHISTKPPYTIIEPPMLADGGGHDYAKCTGGGRAELFARILAIRRVYREGASLDPIAERRFAALAADDAPNDPELMAQGAAIFAQEEASRHWTNAPIPLTKEYDDPAYKPRNKPDNNDQYGGRIQKHRKTQKKRRNAKKTRKQ